MSKIFVTSDTHFGHENIIRYCERPFKDARSMNESLIERWNNRVGVDDTVYFLGDFAMGPGVDDNFIVRTLKRLNGTINVLPGNHDQKYKKCSGLEKIIVDSGLSIEILSPGHEFGHEGTVFVMSHYPPENREEGKIYLHGHKHGKEQLIQYQYDIGVDMYGGPVQITGDLRYLNDPKGWC